MSGSQDSGSDNTDADKGVHIPWISLEFMVKRKPREFSKYIIARGSCSKVL